MGLRCLLFIWLAASAVSATTMPVIGILSQEAKSLQKYFPDVQYHSYIAASYVKYIESAGARVVPIWIGRDEQYYSDIVNKTNGILFPGGATWFYDKNGYADAGEMIYRAAIASNEAGRFFPLWGTCLGMELIFHVELDGVNVRADCDSHKISLPLKFVSDYRQSRMFRNASDQVIDVLSKEDVTVNSHMFCITPTNFTKFGLDKSFKYMSTNEDVNGLTFISSFESTKYPFYGVQFHPEKNSFEFVHKQDSYVNHSKDAVTVAQYFANFFVEQARKNENSFPTPQEEYNHLIYNFQTEFLASKGASYQQAYMFTQADNERR
ncbi:PREDICTED: gamma-glutamyl hydrolase A-like [Nicrophorus vespilloides]|uniref:folate gamma-glutamyl hydrolase n=1 Tax=Nicrophorus vespilloides TaxID=110193 RepID=A0ABM1N9M0_NICVS|nr:PREDICTED: gamma-glutamyl hydrolase A-like [Nicrophorus vespilloides]XP_017783520.1 PREDICTED: gamma-glutamyl hydrolase A-like [Nicrophorus vespilloides]